MRAMAPKQQDTTDDTLVEALRHRPKNPRTAKPPHQLSGVGRLPLDFRLTADEIAALDAMAARDHISRSEAIRRALAAFAA